MATAFRTPVWRLVGATRSIPGVLSHDGSRVAFTTRDGPDFDVDAGALTDVRFPWYYLGGGMTLTVNGERYRFSFLKPNAGEDVPPHLLEGAGGVTRGERVADIVGVLALDVEAGDFSRGRKAGKAWRAALASRS